MTSSEYRAAEAASLTAETVAAARARIVAAGLLTMRQGGRVRTPLGPGRLLSLGIAGPEFATVALDVEPKRARHVRMVDVWPEAAS